MSYLLVSGLNSILTLQTSVEACATISVLVLVVIPAPRGASKVQALALRAALTFFGITVKLKKLIGLIAITIN